MTENESILSTLQNAIDCATDDITREDLEMMVKCLEELQQYRAIGTIEEFKTFKLGRLGNKGFITIGQTMEEYAQEVRAKAIDEFAEEMKWEYRESIGTSEREIHFALAVIDQVAERLKGVQE